MLPSLSSDPQAATTLLASLIEEKTGLFFAPGRYTILIDKLQPRMMECNCPTVLDYYFLLRYDSVAGDEWIHIIAALANHETYFWREFEQIGAMVDTLIPQQLRAHPGRPVRIWHAACATGEEPYTLVMALQEKNPALLEQVEIVASDLSPAALEQARSAVYRPRSFRTLAPELRERYFTPLPDGRFRLDEAIRRRVTFRQLNLMDEQAMETMSAYDMILCRNVFIYFRDSAIRSVLDGFYQALNPSGYLFVASAESLLRLTNQFELVEVSGAFGYRKLPLIKLPSVSGFEVG